MGVVLLVSVTVRCRMLSRIVADSWCVGPTLVAPEAAARSGKGEDSRAEE